MDNYNTTYIGLGSNLGEPAQQINQALGKLKQLPQSTGLHCSPWYTSTAIGPGEQPDYINAVARLQTTLTPVELLHELQRIENDQGRQRSVRWGARTLDLDLLLYDNVIMNTQELQLPHPQIPHRNFVLYPLYDLDHTLTLPDGSSIASQLKQVPMTGLARMDNNEDKHRE